MREARVEPAPTTANTRLAGVLLDIDGTLLDSNAAHAEAWARALAVFGHVVPHTRIRPLIGKGGDKLLAELAGIDDRSSEGKQLSDRRREIFTRELLLALRPTAGARALLEWFADRGLRRVVATSAGGEELSSLLRQAGIETLIDSAASSSDANDSKPDPDIVQAALRKSGLDPAAVLMLGDTPYDIQAAQAAGVAMVALRCVGGWDDAALSGTLAVYDSPADLLRRIAESPFVYRCTTEPSSTPPR